MQAARDFVGIAVELPARVQLCHDDFCRRAPFGRVHTDRNAAAIVCNLGGSIRQQGNSDPVSVARQRFVNRVIDNLIDHMVQARPVIGIADIHARTFANGLQALQNLD